MMATVSVFLSVKWLASTLAFLSGDELSVTKMVDSMELKLVEELVL